MGIFESLFAGRNTAPIQRSDQEQASLDQQTQALTLYQTSSCPYCVRVRRQVSRLGLKIKMVDVYREPQYRRELITDGGDSMVPCLKISCEREGISWLYESADIVSYLDRRFGAAASE